LLLLLLLLLRIILKKGAVQIKTHRKGAFLLFPASKEGWEF
jgi:hypothetical protein